MKKTRRLDNQGLSLVEMIIVVAIIAVVTGVFSMGYSLISTKQVDQCARKIQIALESSRTTTMGKLSADLSFYTWDGKIVVNKNIYNSAGIDTTVVELGGKDIKVQYVVTDGAASTTYDLSSSALVVEFDRASGSLKALPTGRFLSEFIVSNTSGTKTLHVKIDKLTGRVTVD